MHLDQLRHAGHGTHRADPDQASKAITVGSLRHASQRPAASQIREPRRRGREAQIQQHLASYEHFPSRPGKMITLLGTKVPTGRHAKGVFADMVDAVVVGLPTVQVTHPIE